MIDERAAWYHWILCSVHISLSLIYCLRPLHFNLHDPVASVAIPLLPPPPRVVPLPRLPAPVPHPSPTNLRTPISTRPRPPPRPLFRTSICVAIYDSSPRAAAPPAVPSPRVVYSPPPSRRPGACRDSTCGPGPCTSVIKSVCSSTHYAERSIARPAPATHPTAHRQAAAGGGVPEHRY